MDLLLVAVQHCSYHPRTNRDAIVGAFVAALLFEAGKKVSRFISPCSRHISSFTVCWRDPHSLCLGLLDMVYRLAWREITVTLGEYRKLKQAAEQEETTNHDCINSTRNPCQRHRGGEVTGEIGAGLLVLLGVEKDTTNRKQTVCASVCSATASLACRRQDESQRATGGRQCAGGSQFTLAADTERGMRPSFSKGHHRIAQRRYMTISSNAAVSKDEHANRTLRCGYAGIAGQ